MRLAVVLFVVAACQSAKSRSEEPASKKAPATTVPAGSDAAYAKDIANLCNAEKLSGALDQPPEAREIMVAQWLGPNLTTQRAHDLLVRIQPMAAAAKAAALDAEAQSVGLTECPTARAWKP